MNKKFSTLLAGVALMSAFSANATITGYSKDKLHQLEIATGQVLSVTKSKVTPTADSLVIANQPSGLSVTSEAYKKSLWKITESSVDLSDAKAYTLTNYATGSVLSLDLTKAPGILVAGKQAKWNITEEGGKISISAKIGSDTYAIYIGKQDKSTVDEVLLGKGKTAQAWALDVPTAKTLEAVDLNNLYSTSFKLKFDKALDGNPIDNVPLKAKDVDGNVTLQLNDGKYLVVDSTRWPNSVDANKYWKITTDAMPTKELEAADYSAGISASTVILENGRAKQLYQFSASLNIADGYKITLTPKYLPGYVGKTNAAGAATEGKDEDKQTMPSYDAVANGANGAVAFPLAYADFANSKTVMTVSTGLVNTTTAGVSTAKNAALSTFGVAEVPAAIDANYTYYVKYLNKYKADGTTKNKDVNKYAYVTCDGGVDAIAKTAQAPSYMWYLTNGSLANMMVTREAFYGQITLIEGSVYAFGTDTIELTKGPKVADAKKLGYKAVTKADEANGALSFRLVSKYGNDIYVIEDKGVLYALPTEMDNALKLKVVPAELVGEEVATVAGSNDVLMPAYYLTDRLGKKVLSMTSSYGWQLVAFDEGEIASKGKALSFQLSGVGEECKMITVAEDEDEDTWAITAKSGTGILYVASKCDTDNNTFEFVKKDAPSFGTPARGHVQITTREDDGKVIAPQKDGFAALKAAGQELRSDIYTKDTLTMWLDTASLTFDETMPLYYISTNAFVTDSVSTRNYLMNTANISAAIDAANEKAVIEGEPTVANNYPFAGANYIGDVRAAYITSSVWDLDSIAIKGDTIKIAQFNPAAVAFEVAAEVGDEYYRIVSKLKAVNPIFGTDGAPEETLPYNEETADKYLAQLNNVLFWTADKDKAEIFVIKTASTPTTNEGVTAPSAIRVTAKAGAVEISGAQGKKVAISNILGQVIANTVISSDNATIAAPQGIVVVAVEGEAAVKAIIE